MSSYDFSDLQKQSSKMILPTVANATNSDLGAYKETMLKPWFIVLATLCGIVGVLIAGLMISAGIAGFLLVLTLVSVASGLCTVAYIGMRNLNKNRIEFRQQMDVFMAKNGLRKGHAPGFQTEGEILLAGLGSRHITTLGIHGLMASRLFNLYVHTYFKKHKYGEDSSSFTVFHFKLDKPLPHIVLDSRKNDGIISSVPRFFDDEQRIELEGDFNEYFDLFAPQNYSTETLDILSPDFMLMLMDFQSDYDVEINKTDVYIIGKGVKYDQQSMQELFRAAEVLIEKFNFKLQVWSMAASQKNPPELESHTGESAIRIGRWRITTAIYTIPLFSLIVAVRLSEIGFNIWAFLAIFAGCIAVLTILRKNKRKRN